MVKVLNMNVLCVKFFRYGKRRFADIKCKGKIYENQFLMLKIC